MVIDDFKDATGKWVATICVDYKQDYTKAGRVYSDMQQRCKIGGYQQNNFPRYIGCTMSKNFQDFQFFAEWCYKQIGYNLNDKNNNTYHLDKDILVPGNKLYSEDVCVFVPAQLNTFMLSHNASRGVYPQGVSYHKASNKFNANISINGKQKHLGLFKTPEDAYVAYKQAKEQEAGRWYQRLINKEFIVDERVIEAMRIWNLNERLL